MESSETIFYWNYIRQIEEEANSLREEIKRFILPRVFMESIFDLVKYKFTKKLLDFYDKFYMQVPFSLQGSILRINVLLGSQVIWRELYNYPLEVVSSKLNS